MSRFQGNGWCPFAFPRIQVLEVEALGRPACEPASSNQVFPHLGLGESVLRPAISRPTTVGSAFPLGLPASPRWCGRVHRPPWNVPSPDWPQFCWQAMEASCTPGRSGPGWCSEVAADPCRKGHQQRANGVAIGGPQALRSGRRGWRFDRSGYGARRLPR